MAREEARKTSNERKSGRKDVLRKHSQGKRGERSREKKVIIAEKSFRSRTRVIDRRSIPFSLPA